MDELFDNIKILVPIAFFIAIRIISARNKQNKKKDSESSVAPVKKTYAPPAAGRPAVPVPHWEREPQAAPARPAPVWPDTRKAAAAKPQQVKTKNAGAQVRAKTGPQRFAPDMSGGDPAEAAAGRSPAQGMTGAAGSPGSGAPGSGEPGADRAASTAELPVLRSGLSPLQQAFVWADIIGPPKCEQG